MFSPSKNPMMQPFQFTESEKDDLIEFLKSLTDQEALRDPRWRDPWTK
jgi:cytochrome c peroxidase